MIAHQGDAAALEGETAHAVELARHKQAVVHRFTALGDDAVGKALRQIEQPVGVGDQRTVAFDLVDVGFGDRLDGGARLLRQAGEGEGGGPGGEQAATVQTHGDLRTTGGGL